MSHNVFGLWRLASPGFLWAAGAALFAGALSWAYYQGRTHERDKWELAQLEAVRVEAEQRARTQTTIARLKEDSNEISAGYTAAVVAINSKYEARLRGVRAIAAERLRQQADRQRSAAVSDPAGAGSCADAASSDGGLPRCVAEDRRPELLALLRGAELDAQRLVSCQATLTRWRQRINAGAVNE